MGPLLQFLLFLGVPAAPRSDRRFAPLRALLVLTRSRRPSPFTTNLALTDPVRHTINILCNGDEGCLEWRSLPILAIRSTHLHQFDIERSRLRCNQIIPLLRVQDASAAGCRSLLKSLPRFFSFAPWACRRAGRCRPSRSSIPLPGTGW